MAIANPAEVAGKGRMLSFPTWMVTLLPLLLGYLRVWGLSPSAYSGKQ